MNDAPPNDFPSSRDSSSGPSTDGSLKSVNDRDIREAELKRAVAGIIAESLRSAKPQEKQEIATRIAHMVVTHEESYSGDLPHPMHLRGFEDIVPGAAKKIIDNTVNESEHRRNWEDKALVSNFKLASRAQIFGFTLSVILIIGGIALGLNDKTIVACAMLVPGVLGTAFNLIKVGQKQYEHRSESSKVNESRSTSSKKTDARQNIARRK